MPSSFIHIAVAREVLKQIPLDENEFLYGNILPDFTKENTFLYSTKNWTDNKEQCKFTAIYGSISK